MTDQIKIILPTIEISDEFVSPTEYLRLIVTQQAEHLGLFDGEKAYAIVMAHQAYTCAYLKTHFSEEYTRAAMYVAASGTL